MRSSLGDPTSVPSAVEVHAGPVFTYVGGAALVFVLFGAITWASATAVTDPAGETGSAIFLLCASAILALTMVGRRNVKLFANDEVVGRVNFFGATRVCLRSELAEVRVIWHRYTGRGMGMWVFPTLHFIRRDLTDALATPAIYFRTKDLLELAQFLGRPISLERPAGAA
jgi:hypothetical protein